MKTTHMLCASLACLVLSFARPSDGATFSLVHIGLSPYQSSEDSKAIRRQVGQFILQAPPDTIIVVHDAYELIEIARFQIPQLRFDSPEERARRLAVPFGKMVEWYKRLGSRETTPLLTGSGALRIPEFLQNLSQQSTGEPYAVLIIGNPLTLSVEEPTFSMVGGKVPSDGHLWTNVAASIYGTAEKAGLLSGCLVHHCYLREDIWANQLVKESVQRVWGLFISQQAGLLVDFTADMNRVFATVMQKGLAGVGHYQLDPSDLNLEMRFVNERSIPLREVKKVTIAPEPVVTNILVREVKTVVLPTVPVVTNIPPIPVAPRGRVGIAVWWQADADVDLYVSVPGQIDLSYRHTRHNYGEYYRDIRRANEQGTEQTWRAKWEYVELSEEVPTEDLGCWLNLFKVNGSVNQPIAGKVRVQHGDGRISESSFAFTVTQGNGGANSANRGSSTYWVPIDIRSVPLKQQAASVNLFGGKTTVRAE